MISDEEFAARLREAWYQTGQPERGPLWLAFARRARELLLPKEAEEVLDAAAAWEHPNCSGVGTNYGDHNCPGCRVVRAIHAYRAYRAAQEPKERTLIFPDANGYAIKETDYPDLMAMLNEWRRKREAK